MTTDNSGFPAHGRTMGKTPSNLLLQLLSSNQFEFDEFLRKRASNLGFEPVLFNKYHAISP